MAQVKKTRQKIASLSINLHKLFTLASVDCRLFISLPGR